MYCNFPDIFPDITFNAGINIVFAKVKQIKKRESDSHNLGKTFLSSVIDFVLLAQITKSHPFNKRKDLFSDFIFYLELQLNNGMYATIRRATTGRQNIAINQHSNTDVEHRDLELKSWTYHRLGLASAKETLDNILGLSVLQQNKFSYRKGLRYFIRKQPQDYADVLRISKFIRSNDPDWKPFIGAILGFDPHLILSKYSLDEEINKLKNKQKQSEIEAGGKVAEFDKIRGMLEIKEESLLKSKEEIDKFSFADMESRLQEELVSSIENRISSLNKRMYIVKFNIQEIDKAISTSLNFDLDQIKQLFEEVKVVFPEFLTKSYNELLDFNKSISNERLDSLNETKSKYLEEMQEINAELKELDNERQQHMEILQEATTLEKYKQLQSRISNQERELYQLRNRLELLDVAAQTKKEIQDKTKERAEIVEQVETLILSDNEFLGVFRTTYSSYVESIIELQALLSVNVNKQGNLDFDIITLSSKNSEVITLEGEGASYKKILCACFDMSMLDLYAHSGFYRFVYHDGIFEGLDNRKKLALLDTVRQLSSEKDIQYILTVIDTDLPRDESDNKLMFTDDEIIRELDDSGVKGRLFRMEAF